MRKFWLIVTCLALAACGKESDKNEWSRQESNIEKYIQTQLSAVEGSRVLSEGGVQRLVLKEGSGEELSGGGTVSFYYAGYVMKSTSLTVANLFATNHSDTAQEANWTLSDENALNIKTMNLSDDDLVSGLRKGLKGVRGGEECVILFSGKYGFGKKQFGTIPANAALAYHIWVESISND